ncbi:phenylacetate--CoA ligase family protein [Parasphingorhabdus pacifica]
MAHSQRASPPLLAPDAEAVDPQRRRALQETRLQRLIDRLLVVGGLQADRLREHGVDSGADVRLGDLHRLPTVDKRDLAEHYPYGLRASRADDIVAVHGSSGTHGEITLVPYTAHDVHVWTEVMARALAGAGTTRRSSVHSAFGYGLFTGGLGMHYGAMRLGATALPASSGATDRQLRMVLDLRPDVLCCTPSYAIYLGESFRATGIAPGQLSPRVGLFGAEPWTTRMRDEIEELLGLRALDIYGITEIIGPGVACESLDSGGLLNIAEDHFYPEVVAPDGTPLPDGTRGELVFTTLTKTGMPLLRYRTGDIATLHPPEPDAPRTLRRMSRVLGTTEDRMTIRGVTVFPVEIESVVLADPRVAPHYLVVEDRRDPGQPELLVALETRDAHEDAGRLRRDLEHAVLQHLGLSCTVRVLGPNHFPRIETGKTRRMVRWNHGVAPLPGLE